MLVMVLLAESMIKDAVIFSELKNVIKYQLLFLYRLGVCGNCISQIDFTECEYKLNTREYSFFLRAVYN